MRLWSLTGLTLCWAGFILGTSSTVVSPAELFSIVGGIVGEDALQKFQILWGVIWFAVVKGWHITEFAILTASVAGCFNAWWPTERQSNILIAAAIALMFAISDEFHQSFVPTRGATVQDVAIDAIGVCATSIYMLRR